MCYNSRLCVECVVKGWQKHQVTSVFPPDRVVSERALALLDVFFILDSDNYFNGGRLLASKESIR